MGDKGNSASSPMKSFTVYTSINTRNIDSSIEAIRSWKRYAEVEGIRLIQNERECVEVSGYIKSLPWVRIINTREIGGSPRCLENPKELPSLRQLLLCMRRESLRDKNSSLHIYLNSDIAITDSRFFQDLGSVDGYIALLHRKDISCHQQ